MRTRLAVVAGLLAAATTLAGCSAGSTTSPSTPPTTGTVGTTGTTGSPATGATTTGATTTGSDTTGSTATTATTGSTAQALVPLWPFTTLAQVGTWQAAYRSSGSQPWHLDAGRTAMTFTRDHLGYTDVDRVSSLAVRGPDAHVGVGWSDPESSRHTVAVLHLVRYGSGADAPWVVVGSDDTDLTLSTPRYGSTVTSPLRVGGVVTGVDESLRIIVLGPTSPTPLGVVSGLPAGGQRTPWSATVRFTLPSTTSSGTPTSAKSGTVVTIAVSTGGHLKGVERFAVTAARVK